jgi:hypothetical protein
MSAFPLRRPEYVVGKQTFFLWAARHYHEHNGYSINTELEELGAPSTNER